MAFFRISRCQRRYSFSRCRRWIGCRCAPPCGLPSAGDLPAVGSAAGSDKGSTLRPFGTLAADQEVDGFLTEATVVGRMGLGHGEYPGWILCALPVHSIGGT